MDRGVAGLACIWLLGLPRRVKIKQGELRIHRPVHVAMEHLPRPGNGGAVEQEGGTELEWGIGAPNAKDLPTKENPSGLKF